MKLRAATRGSPLAMWQTNHIAALLEKYGYQVEPVIVETGGDKDQVSPLHEIGGQGIFVKEVQSLVIQERADFAVHSLKDLPSDTPSELVLTITRRQVRNQIPVRRETIYLKYGCEHMGFLSMEVLVYGMLNI